ncbi:helix-turn-helix domain-containing protein [Arthrobacter sp. NIO-1057]|uniref:helix-turn-helix domain-containing protein n=1 Tax=Arthrobacter sp. NIO-1057 TaxID=993071 RepID=UPI000817C41F|nr:helix-turn-helix transcriptional regulator [Arthrobacter sp. NIO-1057]SCC37167.1 Helix-turn-helix domain-containing protein [Arthrobacter sp. NIO-1057]
MPNSFGRLLRQARRKAGLTQEEMGGEKLSGSYISLVESGHREPTPVMIERISQVLGLDVAEVEAWGRAEATSQAQNAAASSAIRTMMGNRDYAEVEGLAAIASARALAENNFVLFWDMSSFRIEAARARGDYVLCRDLADELLRQDFVAQSEQLRFWVLSYLSVGLRETGQLQGAVDAATEALDLVLKIRESDSGEYFGGEIKLPLLACAAAVSETGDTERIQELTDRLEVELRDNAAISRFERGDLLWALGNLYFAQGQVESAVDRHDQALDLLRQGSADLDTQYRLLRGTVRNRLAAGLTDERTGDLAQMLVPVAQWAEGSDSVLAVTTQAKWLMLTGQREKAQEPLGRLADLVVDLHGPARAAALEMLAHDLAGLSEVETLQMLAEAARLYAEVGDDVAMRRALIATSSVGRAHG